MKNRITGTTVFLFLFMAGGLFAADAEQEVIGDLVRDAYANSPDLRAAYARWQSALEQVPQARSLPDPQVGYGYFIQQMDTRQRFWVEQRFPAFGKRGLRGGVSTEAAAAAADALEGVAADLRREMMEAVASWVLVLRSTQLVEENLDLVQQLEQVALQRYRAAEASQADVLRLQMEAETLKVDLENWRERRPAVQAQLNAIRGRDPDAPVPAIVSLPLEGGAGGLAGVNALVENPDLRRGQSRVREAERARELARRESLPDVTFGVEYMDNRGSFQDEVVAMVSINIPIWQGRYRAMRRQANANLRAAEADYSSRFQRLQANQRLAFYEEADAQRRVRLFREALIPRAHQTLGILESGYKTGESGFLDLLDAQRMLLDLELSLARAESDLFIRRADLQRITGPFPTDAIQLSQTNGRENND